MPLYDFKADAKIKESILDVVAVFPGSTHQYRVDVTILSPFQRACDASHILAAQAAALGKHANLCRYGPTVLSLSFETFGRLGNKSMEALNAMSMDAHL